MKKLVTQEIIPTLPQVPGVDFDDYFAVIESRFANPEVCDTVPRLCQDASNRLPKFILPTIVANLEQGRDCAGLALVVALWCRLCAEGDVPNSKISIDDPQAKRLIKQASMAKVEPAIFLQMTDIFGTLSSNNVFVKHFTSILDMLWVSGTEKTLEWYLKQ